MTKEERDKKLKEKEESYYSLSNKFSSIRWELTNIKGYRGGRSRAFKMLIMSLDLATEQVESDYNRYVRRIRIINVSDDLSFMQKALNREKEKNIDLEKKIEEAKTSSGLFISFVRKQLKFNNNTDK